MPKKHHNAIDALVRAATRLQRIKSERYYAQQPPDAKEFKSALQGLTRAKQKMSRLLDEKGGA